MHILSNSKLYPPGARDVLAMSLEVQFVQALTGERIGAVVVSLPWAANVNELTDELNYSLHGCIVQSSCEPLCHFVDKVQESCPLSELRLVPSTTQMTSALVLPLLRSTELRLKNLRALGLISLQPGWRRWYHEFKRTAASMPLLPVNVPSYIARDGFHRLADTDVRPLAAIILQAIAAEARARLFFSAGRRCRSWTGCQHALVRRTGLALPKVREFISKWLRAHSAWVDVLVRALQAEMAFFE